MLPDERLPLRRGTLQGVGDHVLCFFPGLGIHDQVLADARSFRQPPCMRRRSHNFAVVHSLLTVAGETFSTSAISSTVRPAKYRISTISPCRESSSLSA